MVVGFVQSVVEGVFKLSVNYTGCWYVAEAGQAGFGAHYLFSRILEHFVCFRMAITQVAIRLLPAGVLLQVMP